MNNVVLHKLCEQQCCQQGCSAMITHDVITSLFNHQYCYNLLTRLSNDDNNNKQACSINIVFSCMVKQLLLLRQLY